MQDTYSPVVNRINQALRHRATHPNGKMPTPYDVLTRYTKPPAELLAASSKHLAALVAEADIKAGESNDVNRPRRLTTLVPPKQKGRKRKRDDGQPISGLDVASLLQAENRTHIDPRNAIAEFKQQMNRATSRDIPDLAQQMQAIIETTIRESIGNLNYARALNYIEAFRDGMEEMEEPDVYNRWAASLKKKIMEGRMNGERSEMWLKIAAGKLDVAMQVADETEGAQVTEAGESKDVKMEDAETETDDEL
jgi:ATP-dependent DNA helicase 2 subunit 2